MCVMLHLERIAMGGMSEEDTDVCWPLVHHLPQCFLQSFFIWRRSVEMAFSKLHQNEPTFLSFSFFIRLSAASLFTTPFRATVCKMRLCDKSRRLKNHQERKTFKSQPRVENSLKLHLLQMPQHLYLFTKEPNCLSFLNY